MTNESRTALWAKASALEDLKTSLQVVVDTGYIATASRQARERRVR